MSSDVIQAYMGHIQDNAEESVRAMLKEICEKFGDGSKVNEEKSERNFGAGEKVMKRERLRENKTRQSGVKA